MNLDIDIDSEDTSSPIMDVSELNQNSEKYTESEARVGNIEIETIQVTDVPDKVKSSPEILYIYPTQSTDNSESVKKELQINGK